MPPQVIDLSLLKSHRLEEFQRLFEAGSDQKIPPRREGAHEKFEGRARLEAGLVIPRRHRQFVQVGQQAGMGSVKLHGLH